MIVACWCARLGMRFPVIVRGSRRRDGTNGNLYAHNTLEVSMTFFYPVNDRVCFWICSCNLLYIGATHKSVLIINENRHVPYCEGL